jgi:hypothetical protein
MIFWGEGHCLIWHIHEIKENIVEITSLIVSIKEINYEVLQFVSDYCTLPGEWETVELNYDQQPDTQNKEATET